MISIANVKSFDKSNAKHRYVGRFKCHRRDNEIPYGNIHKIGWCERCQERHDRESAIEAFKKDLWQDIRQCQVRREDLRQLHTTGAVLFCHCSPRPCHAEIIARAAEWLCSVEGLMKFPRPIQDHDQGVARKRAGDWKVPFPSQRGKTLDELIEENPGYIDWLASFVHEPGIWESTRKVVVEFVSQPWVEDILRREFWDWTDFGKWRRESTQHPWYDPSGPNRDHMPNLTTLEVFIPSLQKTRLFNHGKPVWLKREWRDPNLPPLFDPDRLRDGRTISGWGEKYKLEWFLQSRKRGKKQGIRESEEELALALEPNDEELTPCKEWQLIASIAAQGERASCKEEITLASLPVSKKLKDCMGKQKQKARRLAITEYKATPEKPPRKWRTKPQHRLVYEKVKKLRRRELRLARNAEERNAIRERYRTLLHELYKKCRTPKAAEQPRKYARIELPVIYQPVIRNDRIGKYTPHPYYRSENFKRLVRQGWTPKTHFAFDPCI